MPAGRRRPLPTRERCQPGHGAPPATSRAVIVAGDFIPAIGVLTTLGCTTREVRKNAGPGMAIGNDPILRHIDNELPSSIAREQHHDPRDQNPRVQAQLGPATNSNPQDVAVVGAKALRADVRDQGPSPCWRADTNTTR